MVSSFLMRFLDHTQRRITVGRTPLDEWSARRRDLYLTTHSTHNRQTSMPPAGFEPTISAGERSQTYALDRAATGTGCLLLLPSRYSLNLQFVQVNCIQVLDMCRWVNAIVLRVCFTQARATGHGPQTDSRAGFLRWADKLENLCKESGLYRVSQEECARLRESVPYVKVYRYNPKYLYPKLNGYGDNGQRSLKLWQLLHTYWLPNTY